ncbi:MAG TPA: hypothetical protein VN980_13065 [Alphaproteobacteria bacterium]|nr:hypothetical protein [Alphaproteobacteria bacterium]
MSFAEGALQLGQHPVWKRKTYDQYLGHAAFKAKGSRNWNLRLERALDFLAALLNYDRLYLGGGNARKVTLRWSTNAQRVANETGITGGVRSCDSAFDKIFTEAKQESRPLRRLSPAAG